MSDSKDSKNVNKGVAMAKLAVAWGEKLQEAGAAKAAGDSDKETKLMQDAKNLKDRLYELAGVD